MEQFGEFVTNHLLLFGALVLVLVMLLASLTEGVSAAAREVSPQAAVQLMNRDGAVVVDVRPQPDFRNGHIVGAINVPEASLAQENKALAPHRERPLLLYCATGMVSGRAGRALKKQGFSKLFALKGGVAAWQQENLPLSRD
jgi:rhodanese-related sulfurtransferase